MSVRKMLMVCVVAMAAIIPLVGCSGGESDGGSGAGDGGGSNTTAAE